ncbi:MAG: PocR ligand-binding domain-containing protein [Spirochaetaceae bacterium]|jgi:AraC-like DNA-binding protein/ligand-binding sensor protein|nr:PocR ligand-binding domain-containing protein [Spirochaetaceae bacterium]
MDNYANGGYIYSMIEKLGLFFNEEVQRLIDSFAYCFKVKITIFSSGVEELLVGLQNPGSRFCLLIQQKLRFRYRCCHQDAFMCKRSGQKRDVVVYRCFAGPSESVIPIEIGGTLIGYGMLGQFRTVERLGEEILRDWSAAGFDAETMHTAFREQPFFDQMALDNMLRLFSMLISFVVTREYVKIRRPGLTEKVIQWLEAHITEPPDLDELAGAMNRSRSTISHTIKRNLGLSFKQLCILKRIQRFESLIARDPNLSIQEAAARVGYEDPFYFSRIYKKVRLAPPSTYIKSIREHQLPKDGGPGLP